MCLIDLQDFLHFFIIPYVISCLIIIVLELHNFFPIEIQVRLSDRTSESDGIKLYSLYCYPSSIKVFPWYQLVLYPNESDLSKLSKPHVLLYKIKKDVRETASSIYSKYAHSPNLKLLLILSSTITQKHLDSDKELKDCPITIVIIPEKYKHPLKDFTEDVTKQYEVSAKPVISAQG